MTIRMPVEMRERAEWWAVKHGYASLSEALRALVEKALDL